MLLFDKTVSADMSVSRCLHKIYARRKVGNREAGLVLRGGRKMFEQPAIGVEELHPLQTTTLQGERVAVMGQMKIGGRRVVNAGGQQRDVEESVVFAIQLFHSITLCCGIVDIGPRQTRRGCRRRKATGWYQIR